MSYDFRSTKEIILSQIFSYILATITGAIGLVTWFELRVMIKLFIASSNLYWLSWSLADMVPFVLFGLLWLITVLYCQYYFEKNCKTKNGWKSFFWVTGLEAFVLAIAEFGILINMFSTMQLAKSIGCLVFGAVFVILGRKKKVIKKIS